MHSCRPVIMIVGFAGLALLSMFSCGGDEDGPNAPSDDGVPPARVSNLTAGSATDHSVTLTWTATGDDSLTGSAASYDIRYSTAPITDQNFSSRSGASSAPSPKAPGATESFVVGSLSSGTTYHFAMKVADEAGNLSALSNAAVDTTLPGEAPVAPLSGRIVLAMICNDRSGGDSEIYVYDADRDELEQLTDNGVNDMSPVWSPDGTRIAFLRNTVSGRFDLFVMNDDGSGVISLSAGGPFDRSDDVHWAPDGSGILAITSEPGHDKGYLVLFPPDGGIPDTLLTVADPGPSPYGSPWSPDGSEIVFHSDLGDTYGLSVFDVESGETRPLIEGGQWPIWSCSEDRILFSRWHDNDQWKIDVDGQNPVFCATIGQDYTLSPDCESIAYDEEPEEGRNDLWILDVGSCTSQRIFEIDDSIRGVHAWSPDSRFVLIAVSGDAFNRDSLVCIDASTGEVYPISTVMEWDQGDSLIVEQNVSWTD